MKIIALQLSPINDEREWRAFISIQIFHFRNVIQARCIMQTSIRVFCPFPFVSFHCSSTDMTVIRVYHNIYTYYAEITLNRFTGIISVPLSSNYTFRGGGGAMQPSHVLHPYEILISIIYSTTDNP